MLRKCKSANAHKPERFRLVLLLLWFWLVGLVAVFQQKSDENLSINIARSHAKTSVFLSILSRFGTPIPTCTFGARSEPRFSCMFPVRCHMLMDYAHLTTQSPALPNPPTGKRRATMACLARCKEALQATTAAAGGEQAPPARTHLTTRTATAPPRPAAATIPTRALHRGELLASALPTYLRIPTSRVGAALDNQSAERGGVG